MRENHRIADGKRRELVRDVLGSHLNLFGVEVVGQHAFVPSRGSANCFGAASRRLEIAWNPSAPDFRTLRECRRPHTCIRAWPFGARSKADRCAACRFRRTFSKMHSHETRGWHCVTLRFPTAGNRRSYGRCRLRTFRGRHIAPTRRKRLCGQMLASCSSPRGWNGSVKRRISL